MWMGLRAFAAPSANGSSTIHHKPKFVGSFVRAQRKFCALCRQVSPCLRTARLLPTFSAFFQYGLINVCWVHTETMVRLTFKENWCTVHLVRIVCKPHNVIKVCSVCQALYYVYTPASLHLFVKSRYHSISSNASITCVAARMPDWSYFYIHRRHAS